MVSGYYPDLLLSPIEARGEDASIIKSNKGLCLKLKISITTELIGLSILGKLHIVPMMVLGYFFLLDSSLSFKLFFQSLDTRDTSYTIFCSNICLNYLSIKQPINQSIYHFKSIQQFNNQSIQILIQLIFYQTYISIQQSIY